MSKSACMWLGLVLALVSVGAAAQVTGSGTSGTVPVFTSTGTPSTVGNSPISVSGSNVGIGTTNPGDTLHVYTNASPNEGITIDSNGSNENQAGLRLIAGYSTTNRATRVDFLNVPESTTAPQWTIINDYSQNGTNDFRFVKSDTLTSVLTLLQSGNVGVGTTTPGATLEVNGNVKLTANSGASITFADGTNQSTAWSGTLCGGDYAESVDIDGERSQYEPGDVLVIDPAHPGHFLKSTTPYSRLVAGIYSTKPGMIGRRQAGDLKSSISEIPMAMVGIVPTKVTTENGPIEVGDLIVTSSLPGYAMKGSDDLIKTGSVIGKAISSMGSGTGVIEVLVSLQ